MSRLTSKKQAQVEAVHGDLLKVCGAAMIGGKNLRKALGYETPIAFRVAISKGKVGVPIFRIPGRKGYWALVIEISIWIVEARQDARLPGQTKSKTVSKDSGGR